MSNTDTTTSILENEIADIFYGGGSYDKPKKKSRKGSRKKSKKGSRKKSKKGSRKKSRKGSRKKSKKGSRKKSRKGTRKKRAAPEWMKQRQILIKLIKNKENIENIGVPEMAKKVNEYIKKALGKPWNELKSEGKMNYEEALKKTIAYVK